MTLAIRIWILWAVLFGGIVFAQKAPLREGELLDPERHLVLRWKGPIERDSSQWAGLPDSVFTPMAGHTMWMGWKSGHSLLRIRLEAPKAERWWIQVDYPGLDSLRAEANGKVSGWVGDDIQRSK